MMKKSRELYNVLDECLERLLVRGGTIEQCLRDYPQYADELKPLLEAAQVTKRVSNIQPRPEFRERARSQFYSVLREIEPKKGRLFFSWSWQPQWATVVAIVLVLVLAGGGTVAAARGSMPDNFLYPVKLATEQVQLAFTFSSLGKAELHTELADKRVAEIIYLAENNETEKIEQVTDRLNNDLTEIAILSSPQEVMMAMTASTEVEEKAVFEEAAIAQEAPESEEPSALEEEEVTEEQEAVTAPAPEEAGDEGLLATGQTSSEKVADTTLDRREILKNTLTIQAENNAASLRALLDKVPESAKPALIRAIVLLESGYENALRALDQPQ